MPDQSRKMPKGGRRGGTIFPRVPLKDAVEYAERLVRKTHSGKQPAANILLGVFDNKGGPGKIRASAMKQFGLMDGEIKTGYAASELAKRIVAAPGQERTKLFGEVILRPRVFKTLFDTYHGDRVSRAKLRQNAQHQSVHPDSADECIDIFIQSVVFAGVATVENDDVLLRNLADGIEQANETENGEQPDTVESDGTGTQNDTDAAHVVDTSVQAAQSRNGGRPNVNVSISLDSSLDTEKLEKQLRLLKRFGVL